MKTLLPLFCLLAGALCSYASGVSPADTRAFFMGFTSWPYAATVKAVNDTYGFISGHADLITEHIEEGVPWAEALENRPFPPGFVARMEGRRKNRPKGARLLLSLTSLNMGRAGLADNAGPDGKQPLPEAFRGKSFADPIVGKAFLNYCVWMTEYFKPDYLLTGIEANELLNNSPDEWGSYVEMSRSVQAELRKRFPGLPISESVTLHKLLDKTNTGLPAYRKAIKAFVDRHDFFAVSFYPFFLGLHSSREFADSLEFLPGFSDRPIGIAETGHPAKTIEIKSLKFTFPSSPDEQNEYVKALLAQAQSHRYLFVTYWLWKDFDELWNTFPEASKDLARLWRDTGLVDDNDIKRPAFETWREVFGKTWERK